MKERPIIMSGDNPKLILEGRKTQTRRIIKPQPQPELNILGGRPLRWKHFSWFEGGSMPDIASACSYGVAGDRLWVRETLGFYKEKAAWRYSSDGEFLSADTNRRLIQRVRGTRQRTIIPSIHMPRWASRITLEILKVRVERVQDISYADIVRGEGYHWLLTDEQQTDAEHRSFARSTFSKRWDSLHGKGAWARNDWVWVIEFKLLAS